MASYYKYKSREGEDQIDWRKITQGITDDLTKVATDREGKREAIDQAVLTNLETIADKPQGQDTAQNQLIASYADQASSIALANQKLLKSGSITLKEYTARTNTGGSSTKKLFGLSKKYQENYQVHMDRLKSVDGKPPVGSLLEGAFIQYAEAFSNPDNTRYYMDPATGEAFLAKVSKEGDKGKVQKIDGEAYSLMNVGTAENIITRNVNRYQSAAVAEGLASEAGILKEVVMEGDVKTRTDAFKRMFVTDANGDIIESELSDVGRSTINQIKATFASDMDYASMLTDTMGKTAIAENADGTYTNIITNQKYEGKPGDAVIFETINGQQQPKQSDNWNKQKKQAEREVLNQVKSKLGIEETARADTRMKDYESAMLGLKRKELADLQNEKSDAMNVQVRTMADLYSGGQVDVKAATEYFRDINPSVSLVERIPGGISVTYTDDNGTTVKRPVVFGIENPKFNPAIAEGPDNTRFSMIENTNFDESQPEGPDNQKLIPEIKNQRDFILSAGNLLIGSDEAKKREFTNIVNAKNSDGQFVLNETLSNVSAGSAAEITETPKQQKFDIAFDTYLDEKLEDEIFSKKEVKLKESLTKIFTDMGLNASPIGGSISNEVLITVRGYTGDPLRIDGNNYTTSGKAIEKEKLKKYLRLVFKQRPDLSDTLKINDTEGNQVLFTPDPVKKTKGFG